ncbi:MAG: N-acetyltransferase [Bacteroidetes bacterium]|nr:MAG: N-acetyltransferase [Bacteroidota bacterium]
MNIRIETWTGPLGPAERALVFHLYQSVFGQPAGPALLQKWETRMPARGLALVAFADGQPAGYKVGYAQEPAVFYSWLGGVLPDFRRQGIAQQLLDAQHHWCRQEGFATIRTKTLNQWKGMLLLNLQNGFDIVHTYKDSDGTLKIVLEKELEG